jgi:hypothetical protein
MQRPSGPRKTANLSESVHQQLNTYALAASAAGVSLLALAAPAEAKIVYTPAHVKIAPDSSYDIDLDHNRADVYLSRYAREGFSWVHATAGSVATRNGYALAIFPGAKIGSARHFGAHFVPLASVYSGYPHWYFPWANGGKGLKNRYLGIKFTGSDGHFHYGWARVTVTTDARKLTGVLLTGYAYETIPGKAIVAGKTKGPDEIDNSVEQSKANDPDHGAFLTSPIPDAPQSASLGMLALGVQGVQLWRRKETQEGQ